MGAGKIARTEVHKVRNCMVPYKQFGAAEGKVQRMARDKAGEVILVYGKEDLVDHA